ncbi:LysR substrate-binding domain-containing protein [Variovorax sp. EL159]|uniref:LysR substrate-binding domain-containing protein n=1 Tax=Variovorax sp. EL159 TaxID=1566270 RepID=UPI00088A14A8|nr:LysR substrate-binding domain-containing protein [Variovorax sp. EL159]SCX72554.1 transcriptional regulator, LysR family [Variovorax sp. EL159]
MLDLNDFRYFVRIVESGGLTAASRRMNVPKSTVSYRLQQLETSLGVRLINRTSRSQSMTEAGELFYRHAVATLERADLAESSVRERLAEPSGTIRFTTAVATSLFVMRYVLPAFLRRYPKVRVIQHTSDEPADIGGGSFDLAIRAHTGPLSDSTLVSRVLAPAPWFLFAAPEYLAQRGEPVSPEDLTSHDTLAMLHRDRPMAWKLRHPTHGEFIAPLEPRVGGNDLLMLMQAAREGLGIAALPGYVCREDAETGKLRQILPDWRAGEASITAVTPHRNGMLPSVRVFLDFLIEEVPKIVY